MTTKSRTERKQDRREPKRPKLKKETVKDLTAEKKGDAVRGGKAGTITCNGC